MIDFRNNLKQEEIDGYRNRPILQRNGNDAIFKNSLDKNVKDGDDEFAKDIINK